jgi:membrane protease subunit (stomatin/prohibitin family)
MYGRWDSIKVNDPKMFIRNRTEKEREKVKVKVIKEKSLSNIENLAKVWGVVEYGEGTQWKKNYADDEVPELAQRSLSHLEELLKSYSD